MIKIISGFMKLKNIEHRKIWALSFILFAILSWFLPKIFLELKLYFVFILIFFLWLILDRKILK